MTKIYVVNKRLDPYDVYIGRGSVYGNPYTHKQGTKAQFIVSTKEEAIQKYIEWLENQKELLLKIPELRGKILACYCAPKGGLSLEDEIICHGQILAILANT